MYDMMKRQNFGVEIELTGITRRHAAQVIADYFGTAAQYYGTGYQTYTARDRKGRTWKTMRDTSIRTYRKEGRQLVSADTEYSCEVVTPYSSTRTLRTSRTSSAPSAPPAPSPMSPAASTSTSTAPTTPPPASSAS